MSRHHRSFVPLGKAILAPAVALSIWGTVMAAQDSTIFAYDGQDFVRTHTTLVTEDGELAVNTKLDHGSPAYMALIHGHSYAGKATLFGKTCDATYAPVTDDGGHLTGALFVCFTQ